LLFHVAFFSFNKEEDTRDRRFGFQEVHYYYFAKAEDVRAGISFFEKSIR
jgi:hypothetical protein